MDWCLSLLKKHVRRASCLIPRSRTALVRSGILTSPVISMEHVTLKAAGSAASRLINQKRDWPNDNGTIFSMVRSFTAGGEPVNSDSDGSLRVDGLDELVSVPSSGVKFAEVECCGVETDVEVSEDEATLEVAAVCPCSSTPRANSNGNLPTAYATISSIVAPPRILSTGTLTSISRRNHDRISTATRESMPKSSAACSSSELGSSAISERSCKITLSFPRTASSRLG